MRERVAWSLVAALVIALAFGSLGYHLVRIPDETGKRLDLARADLRDSGLQAVTTRRIEADYPLLAAEDVFDQSPKPGSLAIRGSAVRLQVETTEDVVEMPFLVGKYAEDARKDLDWLGLRHSLAASSLGIVVSQEPSPGAMIPFGTKVNVRAVFPHRKGQPTSSEVRRVHGLFYARYGVGMSSGCNDCHSEGTCYGKGCHLEKPYEDLLRWSPNPR